jgi:hypothetical protein
MPIKDYGVYGGRKALAALRAARMELAQGQCEWRDGGVRCNAKEGRWGVWVAGGFYGVRERNVERLRQRGYKVIRIKLTTAHLTDPTPQDSTIHVRMWCQRHHLAADRKRHAANAARTLRERARGEYTTD